MPTLIARTCCVSLAKRCWFGACVVLILIGHASAFAQQGAGWKRHTIDNSSRGADGIRLADANGDGRLDIATGWEEGGVVRVYLQPEKSLLKKPWPQVTVGNVKSAEDAILVDLDGDGALDVVSSCEGGTKTIFFHFAPADKANYLNSTSWKTVPLTASQGMTRWMFALAMDVDGKHGPDLVVASKQPNAQIGWFESPVNPRNAAGWKFHSMRKAGWVMSLLDHDMDQDGDLDVVVSDRKGQLSGMIWLENRGQQGLNAPWKEHNIGANKREVMFIDAVDDKAQRQQLMLAAVKPNYVSTFRRNATSKAVSAWSQTDYRLAPQKIGTAKSVRRADINLDGHPDIVFSCEQANQEKHGVVWFTIPRRSDSQDERKDVPIAAGQLHSISGPNGVKFDLLQLMDVDQDGDLDVLTCEERSNLGVVWYENPTRGSLDE
jgi:hypothetical protein